MKRKWLITLCLVLLTIVGWAQLYDAQWVIGPTTSVIDFRNDTVTVNSLSNDIPFFLTNACISDESGELLYTCYGSCVTDKYGDTLFNGENLSPCAYSNNNPIGFAIQQAAIFLPKASDSRYYYLFHFSNDTLYNGSSGRPGTLYYSIIDKEGNFGLGEVIDKNHIYYKGIFRGGGMTACKHANGRDWLIVIGGRYNNRYNTFLLTPDGITDTLVQFIGPNYNGPYDVAYSCFSQNGSKYATIAYEGYVTVFDFDRCSGELSNPQTIFNNVSSNPISNPITGGAGLAFSPNGRFLYVTGRVDLNQYDLWAANIQDSVRIYTADSTDFAQIHFLQLAPNGKLYGSCWSGGFYFLHVLNKPDEKGDSCAFIYAGQPTLSDNSFNLPNMPNYRLGALGGSGCDTITASPLTPEGGIKPRIQPNPADKAFYIEMPEQGNYVFELINTAGQVVERRETKQVDIINVQGVESGNYILSVTQNNIQVGSKKVVVLHP